LDYDRQRIFSKKGTAMLAPVPRNLARWVWIHEAKRAPSEETAIANVAALMTQLSPQARGLLVVLFRAAAYPFNKERERRGYAEAFLRAVIAEKETVLPILQDWHDFIVGKMADMDFLKDAKFTMSDARDLLEKTQQPLSLEDKTHLARIAETCAHTEERIQLQKRFVEKAIQSQVLRALQQEAVLQEPEVIITVASVVPMPPKPAAPIAWSSHLPKIILLGMGVLGVLPCFIFRLCQVAVGFHVHHPLDWVVPRWIQQGWGGKRIVGVDTSVSKIAVDTDTIVGHAMPTRVSEKASEKENA